MQQKPLGRTDIMVSDICLGSMTWGSQNTEAEGHAQIDRALEAGVNFIDTAEMYPVTPIKAETVGNTEAIIGTWLEKTGRRSDVVLATKITGANGGFCRGGEPISADATRRALDGSLQRLRTDYVDLYQLHWPNRGSYCFRQNWDYDPSQQDRGETVQHMEEVLGELQRQVEAGKIRHVGLSNETAWGTSMWLRLADENGWPRMQSIQNEYSLLHRLFDTDLAEMTANEQVGCLAYSPLATGLLTGKYAGGAIPEGSRRTINADLGGRMTPRVDDAVATYAEIAKRHDLDLVQMAIAFCRSRPFMTSTIIGATSLDQLDLVLGAADVTLPEDVLAEIGQAHRAHPLPY
ncbi:aldo/keto reductase [Rhodobacteraceae bacterium SC52]|nr:aldo/keto reductase [Rhodobacteraceae bacterium SC52]